MTLSRDVPLKAHQSALLFIDVQNYCAHPEGSEFKEVATGEVSDSHDWYFSTLERTVIPNMQRLQASCRRAGVEVLYTTIESLTKDGRDRSLDYKITGSMCPKAPGTVG